MGFAARADRRYQRMLERLFKSRRFGVDLELHRIHDVARALGAPHRRIPVRVVVAGTNGKGSTCAFLESIALAAGRRVGVFSSPHLARFVERFRINGEPASEVAVALAAERVCDAGGDALTFFEQCTAIALQLFGAADLDIAIFEVGLGGRLDSTQAAEASLVLVTGVALDHQAILGDSLEAIAVEKVGAAGEHTPLILGQGGAPGSLAALESAAKARALRDVSVASPDIELALGLPGRFQRANAACAAAAARQLGFGHSAIADGLAQARLPARFETLDLPVAAEVIVDGAHNGAGARALGEALDVLEPKDTLVVLGVSADKDIEAIARPLLARASRAWVSAASSDRALACAQLRARLERLTDDSRLESVPVADLRERIETLDHRWRVVIAGSLIFVGETRALLLGERQDVVALTDPAARSAPT